MTGEERMSSQKSIRPAKSKVLCTMPGKYGDIFWSLLTVKALAVRHGDAVDFLTTLEYGSRLGWLLADGNQPYIRQFFTTDDWQVTESGGGLKPVVPPGGMNPEFYDDYEFVYHLGYQKNPMLSDVIPLREFIARQQGVVLPRIITPWITWKEEKEHEIITPAVYPTVRIAYAFNEAYEYKKREYLEHLQGQVGPNCVFVNVGENMAWTMAAKQIANSTLFVGDRSACWVLAQAIGKFPIFTFEPDPNRCTSVFEGLGRDFIAS